VPELIYSEATDGILLGVKIFEILTRLQGCKGNSYGIGSEIEKEKSCWKI
jgi:hypothetical protein